MIGRCVGILLIYFGIGPAVQTPKLLVQKSLEMAQTFITDLVRRAIKSCRNSKAFGPNKLSIFHLKHLGPRAIEYITTLFNLSVTTCQIPAIWKCLLIIPIPNLFVSAYLAFSRSRKRTGVSDSAHHQQISPTCSRPTRF